MLAVGRLFYQESSKHVKPFCNRQRKILVITHPDIVLLILDTQRADRLSCYGYPVETSPHLDEFATDSAHFRFAVSPANWTVPSHTSLFTGVYPSSHGTLHASSVVPPTLPTLAERLRDSGYFTAAFCNNPLVGVVNNGLRRGFLDFFNYSGLLTSRPNQAGVYTNMFDRTRQRFKRGVANSITAMQDIFARSDALLDLSFSPLMVPLWQTALSFKGNTARSLNDAARLHVERKGVEKGQPVFSFINLMETHMPYHPPLPLVEKFVPHMLHDKAARRYLRHFNSDVFGWLAPLANSLDEKSQRILNGMYCAEVAYLDELVGAFFQKLRASGRLDQTLVIVSADHGEHLGEKQFVGHGLSVYNELVHVPLMIRDPSGSLPRGTTVDTLVSTRRIFHTILETAGLASANERDLTLAQSSTSDPDKGVVFSECIPAANTLSLLQRRAPHLIRERDCDLVRRAVYTGRHKLIKTGENQFELYDFYDDPNEETNLRDLLPEQVEGMEDPLTAFVNHVVAPAPIPDQAADYDDPQVRRRLHDLGYLE
jgi:arylsulfatase A-like enzyme